MKRVVRLLKKDEAMKKEEAPMKEGGSHSKKETTKDMVARWSEGSQGCSKDVRTWRT
jgi:hypothetical protein